MKKTFLILFFCLLACQANAFSLAKEFSGKTLGVQLGTSGDILASDTDGIFVERYNKAGDAVQSLLNRKIDGLLIDEAPARVFVLKNKNLRFLNSDFATEEYSFVLSKKNPDLKQRVNVALNELFADKTIEKIVQNYIGDETKGKFPYVSDENKRNNGVLKIATNATFPPYEFYENGKITGIDIDIARAVADKLGKRLIVSDMEFDAIIPAVQSGKADMGVAGITITPERLKNIDFSISYAKSQQAVLIYAPVSDFSESSFSWSQKFYNNFIADARWKYMATGLINTLLITFFAVLISVGFGGIIALICACYEKNGTFCFLNFIFKIYLAVIRGTPVMIQLLIMYYVIFSSWNVNKILVAVLAFGLNSAAYVAEIIRSGISSVDEGQFEAGRSLGLTFHQTMRFVILPQAVKNILPALANEFIVLLKETSICGYIGLMDLTRGGDIIRSVTYDAFLPLTAVAVVYLTLVFFLTTCVGKLEKRLKKNER